MAEIGSILAVPRLDTTTPLFRFRLLEMCRRNGWDADAVAAVISSESGFEPAAKNPKATASGLIQFIDSTARSLGVADGAAGVRRMSAVEQLALVEKYYQRVFTRGITPRPVDFYLAGWGRGIGAPMATVLARADAPREYNGGTENLYTLNKGLDRNGDGVITVADLDALVRSVQSRAGGQRIPVHDTDDYEPGPAPAPLAEALASAAPSASLRRLASSLSPLQPGRPVAAAERQALALLTYLLGRPASPEYSEELVREVRAWQNARRLRPDGVVGPITWTALLAEVRPWR